MKRPIEKDKFYPNLKYRIIDIPKQWNSILLWCIARHIPHVSVLQ